MFVPPIHYLLRWIAVLLTRRKTANRKDNLHGQTFDS